VDATRRAIDDHEKEGISETDPRMQDLRVTSLAVNYGLIGWRVGRNRVLIGDDDGAELKDASPKKLKRSQKSGTELVEKQEGNGRKLARLRERVVLYDAILQSIDSVKELPGAAEISFREELEGKRAYFQALKYVVAQILNACVLTRRRCLNIAYSHALLCRHKETLALLQRAESLSSTALAKANQQSTLTSSGTKQLDISPSLMQSLHTRLKDLINHYRALVEMHNLSTNSRIAAEKHMNSAAPIIERLNEYPLNGVDLKNLVTYPPKVQPVPVKPLFLDVAWNYIDYPGRPSALANGESGGVAESAPPEEKRRGWFAWGSRS
jgi:signal recognition particle subunit SRP68